MRDKSSGKSRGFAFVTFQEPSRDAANQLSKRLLNSQQPHMIQNRIIDVRESDGSKPPDSFLDKQGGSTGGGGSGSGGAGQSGRDNNRNGGRGAGGKDSRGDGGSRGGQKHGDNKRDNRSGNDRDNKGKYGQQTTNQSTGNFGMRGMNPEDSRR